MRGEVTVRVECLLPEKLIQRATARGARFDEIRMLPGREIAIRCDAPSAELLLALCGRYGLSARVTSRRGGSALRRFLRRRGTLLPGIALAAALCALFLSRLWFIDIAFSGETASLGDPAALARTLFDMGVRPGIPRSLDAGLLSQALQAGAGSFSYVGAHKQGVRLLVEAVPEVPAPPVYDVEAARDLICAVDGIVVWAVARSGELCVKPGDAVQRGQLLIRGEELSGKEETRPIAALGEVVVRTWCEGSACLPLSEVRQSDTGRSSTGARLVAPGFDWDIILADAFPSQREVREYLPVGGLFLPLEIERVTRIETRQTEIDLDADAVRQRASALALADAALNLLRNGPGDFSFRRSWVDCRSAGGMLRARAVLEIQTDAATTREALLSAG